MSYFFPNHFSRKLLDYSPLVRTISNERPFEWYIMRQHF